MQVLPRFTGCCWCYLWGSLGISITGTALSASPHKRACVNLLLPVLLLPLLTPILVASTEVTVGLLAAEPFMQWKGIGFLAIFDLVFLTVIWLFGEYLLEE